MPFDNNKYMTTNFKPREDWFDFPSLKDFFEEGEKPGFKVRGLDAEEVATVRMKVDNSQDIQAFVEKLLNRSGAEKAEGILEALGMGEGDTPPDLIRRYEIALLGTVEPELSKQTIVRIARDFPIEFYAWTDRILALTGAGRLGE